MHKVTNSIREGVSAGLVFAVTGVDALIYHRLDWGHGTEALGCLLSHT